MGSDKNTRKHHTHEGQEFSHESKSNGWLSRDKAHLYNSSICNSYTTGCPPVRGDNPPALALGGQLWYNYFIPPTSV